MINTLPPLAVEHSYGPEIAHQQSALDERAVVEAFIAQAIDDSAAHSKHLARVNDMLVENQPTFYVWSTRKDHYYYWPKGNAAGRFLFTLAEPEAYQVYLHLGQYSREELSLQPTLVDAVLFVNGHEQAGTAN